MQFDGVSLLLGTYHLAAKLFKPTSATLPPPPQKNKKKLLNLHGWQAVNTVSIDSQWKKGLI